MPPPIEDRRPPITPQLAVRVAVLGGFAFVLFAIIFFRLWFLQVLTGDDYVVQARENRIRKVKIEAPRGNIVDRDGRTLVKTRAAPVVQLLPNSVPAAELSAAETYRKLLAASEGRRLAAAQDLRELERRLRADGRKSTREERKQRRELGARARRADKVPIGPIPPGEPELRALYKRLGRVIEMEPATIHRRVVQGIADQPSANVTIKTDVPAAAFNYLLEHREDFHGIVVEKKYLRHYPYKTLGAQLFGTLREISPDEVGSKDYRGVNPGTRIGKDGIEESYDSYLRGTDGFTRVIVNSFGNRDDTRRTTRTDPIQGRQLRLTLDLGLQRAAQNAVARGIEAAHGNGNPADAGAFVAMDPRDGEVLALGSYPSFDANLFAKPIDQETYEELNSEDNGAPLFNRAIAAGYPTGSTFKPITALAAVDAGIITPSTPLSGPGRVPLRRARVQERRRRRVRHARAAARAAGLLRRLLLPARRGRQRARPGDPGVGAQARASASPPASTCRASTAASCRTRSGATRSTRSTSAARRRRRCRSGPPRRSTPAAASSAAGAAATTSTSPSARATCRPRRCSSPPPTPRSPTAARSSRRTSASRSRTAPGASSRRSASPRRRRVDIEPATLDAIRSGLQAAAGEPGGTSADVFAGFPYTVHGKTGTAERAPNPDQSWYAAYVDDPVKPIVVVVTIEKGGFGAEAAAPATRLILAKWFGVRDSEFHAGTSATR